MIYLLISVLLVLLVLIIVLAAFIFVQQKQIAIIKDLASSVTPPPSNLTHFTYARKHSERETEIIGVSTYQESLSIAKPMATVASAFPKSGSVLFFDLTPDRQLAQLFACDAVSDKLQSVSEGLAYLSPQEVQKTEDLLTKYSQQFDQIYLILPSLYHPITAAILPHVHVVSLLMAPDGDTETLSQGFVSLSQQMTPAQGLLGFTAVHNNVNNDITNDVNNALYEQVINALESEYSDLFLGVITEHNASDVYTKWSAEWEQQRADKALSLAL